MLSAVLLHGSFDAVLMSINVFVETAWGNMKVGMITITPRTGMPLYHTMLFWSMSWHGSALLPSYYLVSYGITYKIGNKVLD